MLAVVFAFLLALAVQIWIPESAPGRAPACTEYCYEPIPEPGSPGEQGSNGSGGSGQESGLPAGDEASSEASSAVEQALGVVAAAAGRGGNGGNGGDGQVEAGSGAQESTSLDSSQAGASDTWIVLAVVLGLGTLILLLIGIGRMRVGGMSRGDVLLRGIALAAGLGIVFLLSPGVSGASAAKAPKSFFGMMSMTELSSDDAELMARGGVASYRLPINWGLVQSRAEADFDWSSVDSTVEVLSRSRVRVLPFLYGTTAGLALDPTTLPIGSTEQRQAWAGFLRSVIRRYGKSGSFWQENPDLPKLPIRTWQIWNEANFFYFTEPVVPANYLKLLKASHKAIKQEDRGAKVMLSGLYGSPPNDPGRSMKSWQFLAKLYRMGAKSYFDSVAIHPYSPDTTQLRLIIEKVRLTMNRYGGRKTPIDVTEIGWGSDSATAFGKGSNKAQAQQLTSGYDYLIRQRGKMGIRSAYWFAWKDLPRTVESCNFCYSTGLFYAGPGLRPKPAWNALVKMTGGKP